MAEYVAGLDAKSQAKIARALDLLEQCGLALGLPHVKEKRENTKERNSDRSTANEKLPRAERKCEEMNWHEFKEQLMKDPEFKKEYDALETEYRLLGAIIERRLQKGLTQEALARKVGTKQAAIARLESGRANPTIGFLKRVAGALDAELEIRLRPLAATGRSSGSPVTTGPPTSRARPRPKASA